MTSGKVLTFGEQFRCLIFFEHAIQKVNIYLLPRKVKQTAGFTVKKCCFIFFARVNYFQIPVDGAFVLWEGCQLSSDQDRG